MGKQSTLQKKLLLFFIPIILVVFTSLIGYVTIKARYALLEETKKRNEAIAEKYANIIGDQLNNDASVTKGVANALNSFYLYNSNAERMNVFNNIIKRVLSGNENFVSFWANLELKYIDNTYLEDYGRLSMTYIRYPDGSIVEKIDTLDMGNVNLNSFYNRVRLTKVETIVEPAVFSFTGNPKDAILKTTYCVPLLLNDNFAGLVGVDLSLSRFEKLVEQIETDKGGYAFLISNKGILFTYPEKEFVGKQIDETHPDLETTFSLKENISKGQLISFQYEDKKNAQSSFSRG